MVPREDARTTRPVAASLAAAVASALAGDLDFAKLTPGVDTYFRVDVAQVVFNGFPADVKDRQGEASCRMASAYYELKRGSYQRHLGWLITAENTVDGTEIANRLFAAHLDYLAIPKTLGKGLLVPVKLSLDWETTSDLIESVLLPAKQRQPHSD